MASILVVLWYLLSLCLGDSSEPAVWLPRHQENAVVLEVPLLQQVGERANCGPSAVAMFLGAYQGQKGPALERLRDHIGSWSWSRFSLRRWHLPGRGAGLTTAPIVSAALDRFGAPLSFGDSARLSGATREQAFERLRDWLGAGRPVLVLVSSGPLWDQATIGLHWVVVTGLRDQRVVFNDSADRSREQISISRFMEAWHIGAPLTALPSVESYTAFVADQALPGRELSDAYAGLRLNHR